MKNQARKIVHSRNSKGFEEWHEYDENGNEVHYRDSRGFEAWHEYDGNGNKVHFRDSRGFEEWYEYDGNGNKVHCRDSRGFEEWYEYDGNNEKEVVRKENKDKTAEEKEKVINDIISYFAGSKVDCPDTETAIMAEYNAEWDKLPCDPEGATEEQKRMQDKLLEKCADEIIAERKALKNKDRIVDEIGSVLEGMGIKKDGKETKVKRHERDGGMSL